MGSFPNHPRTTRLPFYGFFVREFRTLTSRDFERVRAQTSNPKQNERAILNTMEFRYHERITQEASLSLTVATHFRKYNQLLGVNRKRKKEWENGRKKEEQVGKRLDYRCVLVRCFVFILLNIYVFRCVLAARLEGVRPSVRPSIGCPSVSHTRVRISSGNKKVQE